jgi:hypothetical protein
MVKTKWLPSCFNIQPFKYQNGNGMALWFKNSTKLDHLKKGKIITFLIQNSLGLWYHSKSGPVLQQDSKN